MSPFLGFFLFFPLIFSFYFIKFWYIVIIGIIFNIKYNIKYYTVLCRLRAGWDFPKALLTPPIKRDRTSLIGKRFGRLVVQAYAGDEYIGSDNNSRWICQCDCGNTTIVGQNKLKSGHTQSCGCLQKERASDYQRNKSSKR